MKRFIQIVQVLALFLACVGSVVAGTFTNFPAGTGTSGDLPGYAAGGTYVLSATYNAKVEGEFDSARSYKTTNVLAAADVVQMIQIPSNVWVQAVALSLDTAAENPSTFICLGDGSGTNSWLANTSVTGTPVSAISSWAGTAPVGLTGVTVNVALTGYSAGKLYAAPDTIDAILWGASTTNTLKFTVKAICVPLKR